MVFTPVLHQMLLFAQQEATGAGGRATVSTGISGIQYVLVVIYFVVCVGLIAAVLSQTTKSEGLTGSMMGGSQSAFRGKKSFDDKLSTLTNSLAIAFLVLSMLVSASFG